MPKFIAAPIYMICESIKKLHMMTYNDFNLKYNFDL